MRCGVITSVILVVFMVTAAGAAPLVPQIAIEGTPRDWFA